MLIEASGGGGGTQITPSDATPVALVNGETYEAGGNGYAIETNPNDNQITPTANGASFTSGIKKMLAAGFAFSQMPSVEDYEDILSPSEYTTYTLTNLDVGKKYLLLVWNWSSSANYSNTRFDGATASGGTLTKVTNLREASSTARTAGTFFLLEPSATNVTLTCSYLFQTHLIEAVGGVVPSETQTATGNFTSSSTATISLGFKPKYLSVQVDQKSVINYNKDHSTSGFMRCYGGGSVFTDFATSGNGSILELTNDGFIFRGSVSSAYQGTCKYFAIG